MVATIATAQDMLRQHVEPDIKDQIEIDVLLEDLLNRESNTEGVEVDMKNNRFEIVSKVSGMTAYAGTERATIIYSDAGLDKMFLGPMYVKAASIIGHEVMAATLKDRAALESFVRLYSVEIRKALVRAKGRHIRSDGSGIIAILPPGTQSGTTVTVSGKAAGTILSQARYNLGTQWIAEKQQIEIGTAAQFIAGTAVQATVLAITGDTTFTTTSSVSIGASAGANNRAGDNSATWYIRLKGTYNATPMGLLGLVDDGTLSGVTTLQNKVRSTTPYMRSYVATKANKSTIVKDIRTLYLGVRKNNRNPKYFMVSQDVYEAYTDAITIVNNSGPGEAQYQSKLGTGHTGLMFSFGGPSIPIFMDELLPYGTAMCIDPDFMFCADLFKDDFVPDGVLARVSGTTDYETIRAAYYNFGTFSSRKLGGVVHYES